MRGVLRIAGLLCSTLPLQRGIVAIGLALIALAQIGRLADPRALGLGLANGAASIGLALIFVAISLPLGVTFRAISAPRTLALIPHARIRSLLAVLLVVLTLAAFAAGNFALLDAEFLSRVGPRIGLGTLFIWVLGAETLMVLYFFLLSASKGNTLLVVFLLACIVGSHWSPLRGRLSASWMTDPRFLLLLIAGGWSDFALWYLIAGSISPATWGVRSAGNRRWTWGRPPATGVSGSKGEPRISLSRNSAMRVQLLGLPSVAPIAKRSLGALLIFAILVGMATVWHPAGSLPGTVAAAYMFFLYFALPVGVGLPTAVAAWAVARRSRLLWLQSGCTRDELFRACERLAWLCFGAVAAPVGALCVAVWICLPHPAGDWRYLLVAALAPCACALYIGLMNVRGWKFIDAAAAILTMATAFVSFMAEPRFSHATAVPWIIVGAETLCAIGLRALAQRRWRRIDWLICKPQRVSSWALKLTA